MATELENLVPEADVEVEGMRGPKGDKGDSYVLTEADKEEIARKVDTIVDAETDKTLKLSGKPADAKAAGDEINDLKADLSEIQGKVKMVVIDQPVYSDGDNIVDARGKTASSIGYIDNSIHFNFINGTYFTNPFTTNTGKPINLLPTDVNGDSINMTRGTTTETQISLNNNYLWKVIVNDLTVVAKGYANLTNYTSDTATFNRTYVLSETPAYWRFKGNGYGNGGTIDRGLTIGTYDDEFVEYADTDTENLYAPELIELIESYTENTETKLEAEIGAVEDKTDSFADLIAMTAKTDDVYTGNVINTTGKTAPGSSLDGTIHFVLDDGTYYSNPWKTDTGKEILMYPRDASDNAITITKKNGTTSNYITLLSSCLSKIVINGLDIKVFQYQTQTLYDVDQPTYIDEGTLSEEPDHWQFNGSGYTSGGSIERGLTKGTYNTSYVSYVEPTQRSIYSDKLTAKINDSVDAISNDLLKPSENLLDYSKIIWTASSGYFYLEKDYYMPVTAGTIVETNNIQGYYNFFDSSFTKLSSIGFSRKYSPITVPQNAVWMRIIINSSYTDEGDPIMIWVARSEKSAPYERPIYRPHLKYNAKYADNDIFDYAVPDSLSQGVMRMARLVAIRTTNEMRNAYRFGTFNVYINTVGTGYSSMREMMLDYGLDFLGMQECTQLASEIKSAMYPFQFPYASSDTVSGQESNSIIDTPVISRFEIASTNLYLYRENMYGSGTTNKYACVNVRINMPQNKHYPRRPTLSVYNYHGHLSLSKRLEEIQTLLAVIANDTSDFIIIMGDTNSEVDQQGHRQSWDAWEAAGFRAVHHGESPTWPNPYEVRYSSMDNIFVSEHINVLGYDIITADRYPIESGQDTRPLSDHDLVFADLQFDYDAVLKDTWEEPPTV